MPKEIILTVKLLEELIASNKIESIRGYTRRAVDDNGKFSTHINYSMRDFTVTRRDTYIKVEWCNDAGDPCITVPDENFPIDFLEDCADSDYRYKLYTYDFTDDEPLISKEKCMGCWMWYCAVDTHTGTLEEIIERLHIGACEHSMVLLDNPKSSDESRHIAEALVDFTNMLVNVAHRKTEEITKSIE